MKGVYLFFLLAVFFLNGQAQEKTSHTPFSFTQKRKIPNQHFQLKQLDMDVVYSEDVLQLEEHNQFNVARLQTVDLPERLSISELDDGTKIWKITFQLENSEQLALKFSKIKLPRGSELFFYTEDHQETIYSFDASQQVLEKTAIISTIFPEQTLTLEYNADASVQEIPVIQIEGLLNFYPSDLRSTPGFGQSTECEVNVICEEGDGWCNEAQSVVRILVQSGSSYSYCTGAVVNNVKQDFTPYILTAEHCGMYASEEDFQYWKFDFNYQSLLCESPSSESEIVSQHKIGCENLAEARRMGSAGSDFRLVRLLDSIPEAWNIYYAGWDATDYAFVSEAGVGIHQPYGDIKKISTHAGNLLGTDAQGGQMNDWYWETTWIETPNGHGITEGGSSGSPLFSHEGLIIGSLATGSSYCTPSAKSHPDYYGKFSKHWEANGSEADKQLKYWLDPEHTGLKKLSGISKSSDLQCGEKYEFDDFVIFPNPANNRISLGSDHMADLASADIRIYDIKGSLVYEIKTSEIAGLKQINIEYLSQGIYVLKAEKSSWVVQKKFVILR